MRRRHWIGLAADVYVHIGYHWLRRRVLMASGFRIILYGYQFRFHDTAIGRRVFVGRANEL